MGVELLSECIEWQGARNEKRGGYGVRRFRGRQWRAHRAAWVEAYGEIPEGMLVLHRCDNPPCVNVEHLFLGTQADNLADMTTKGRRRNQHTDKTHCVHGHEFTPENTRVRDGARECMTCVRARDRAGWHRRKAQP